MTGSNMEYTLSIKDLYKCQEGCVHYAMSLEAEANRIKEKLKRIKKRGFGSRRFKKVKEADETRIQSLTDSASEYQKAAIIAGTFFKNMDNYDNID
jgi:hypothetical protein